MSDTWRARLEVVLLITSKCSRRCPHCCFKDWLTTADYEASPESVADDIRALGPVGKIILLGGEATLHPRLEEVVTAARKAIGVGSLWLCTNGARLVEKAAVTALLNGVLLSVFTPESNAGTSPSNADVVEEYRRVKPPHVAYLSSVVGHTVSAGSKVCGRAGTTLSVLDGRVYPCCVAAGIQDAEGTPLTAGWESRVYAVAPPCSRCVFGVP